MRYDTVVGLEVHIQLNTATKAFCGDALSFGEKANTHVSAISLAHPGTLPVVNKNQIDKAIQLGLALNCKINEYNFFDRKHYFYPDLPKGYQITQDNEPICIGGHLEISVNGRSKKVKIHHIHMEEDAGKTIHDQHKSLSLVDLNRAGTPLLELVTEPDLSSSEEVYQFIAELQKLLRYIDVSDADMEKGSMRCDCNVSVKPAGSTTLGERCEIKNLNSKRFAKEAVEYEAKRQIEMIENGISFSKQTLHYNVEQKKTQALREKEGAEDYRYFPDPDLAPIKISSEHVDSLKEQMPKLPWVLKAELVERHQLKSEHADVLTQDPDFGNYFFELNHVLQAPQLVSNFIINQLLPTISSLDINISQLEISNEQVVQYLDLIKANKISSSIASQRLWPSLLENKQRSPLELAQELELIINDDDDFVQTLIDSVISENPAQVAQYKRGKKNVIGFFVGAIMRKSKGAINPKTIQSKLIEALNN